jgi:hypothetical protein
MQWRENMNDKIGGYDFTLDPEFQKFLEMKMAKDNAFDPSKLSATQAPPTEPSFGIPQFEMPKFDLGASIPPSSELQRGDLIDDPAYVDKLKRDIMLTNTELPEAKKDYAMQVAKAKDDAVPGWKVGLGALAAGMQGMATGGQNLSMASSLGQAWDKKRADAGKDIENPQEKAKAQLEEYLKMKALGKQDREFDEKKSLKQMDLDAAEARLKDDRRFQKELYDIKEKSKPSKFDEEVAKKEAKTYADTQEAIKKTATNLSKVDEAINAQLNYSSNTVAGTGPLATMGGAKKYFSQDLENLDARYKDISLNKMVSMFSGMSKAVDSDAERRAFEATTASIKNDDKTNLQILLGSKSSLLKDKAVAEAQANWAEKYGNLKGFEQANPILRGEVTTLVDGSGEMQLVPKSEVSQLKKQGLMDLDSYVNQIAKSGYRKGKASTPSSPTSGGNPWEKYNRR